MKAGELIGEACVLMEFGGSAETLLDDAVRIASRAGSADVRVTLEIWPHIIHAWHLWAAVLEDGRRALESAGGFIRATL